VRPSRFSTFLRGLFRSSSRNRALRPSQNYWTRCVGGSMRCPRRGRQRHCGSVLRPGHVSGRNRLVALRRQRHCTSRATSRLRVQARRAKIYPLFMLEFGEHNGMRGTELCLTSDPRRRHQDRTGEENSQGRNIDVSFS